MRVGWVPWAAATFWDCCEPGGSDNHFHPIVYAVPGYHLKLELLTRTVKTERYAASLKII